MGLIEIEGMHFYAYHGHFEVEQIVGNDFIVNLQLGVDCNKAALSDDLNDALNYQAVYTLIQKEMAVKSRLLENVANRILDVLFAEFSNLENAKVKISKMNPPMGGEIEKVSVTLER
ncbi:MAG: dihydroneopterin aldolase [Bacteroidetes bacterium]|nr:dihydroneopterin aldolase [Bacteroidota bacterium]